MSKHTINDYAPGTRLLIRNSWSRHVDEITIVEFSPSGKWAKMMGASGNSHWIQVEDSWIIEDVLEALNEQPKT